jgi:hypothetical protein
MRILLRGEKVSIVNRQWNKSTAHLKRMKECCGRASHAWPFTIQRHTTISLDAIGVQFF